jgi:membrane protease YdiL (CAAX protease family)
MNEYLSLTIRILRLVGFGLLSLLITAISGGVWTALLLTNLGSNPASPWSVAVMAILLWFMWSYLDGKGWPRSTSEARRRYLRANRTSTVVWGWSVLAGVLSVVALAGLWIVLFRLVPMKPNAIPNTSGYPWLTVVLMVLMGSLVAPFAEEASFRGYFQVALEDEYSGGIAVTTSSLLFAIAHLTHGFYLPKLLVYFLVGVVFGATAYLTNSTLPAILPHVIGDLTFFILVWPHDGTRKLIWQAGLDMWFWIHVGQTVLFGAIAIWAFRKLAGVALR